LQETLGEIERKRENLPFAEDRKRTRRFHRAFLAIYGLALGLSILIAVHEGKLWPFLIGGILIGLVVSTFGAVMIAAVADSTGDLADLWYWITGRKRRRPNWDHIASRVNERAVPEDSLPSDPETSITPIDAAPGSEAPPCPESGAHEAIAPTPPQPPIPPDDQSVAPAG
jgi:hypothetical protein